MKHWKVKLEFSNMLGKNRLELHFSLIPPFVPSPLSHHPSCFDRRWLWVHPQLGHSNVAYTIAHPLRVSKEPCGYLGVENLGGRSDNCVPLSVVTLENDHFPERGNNRMCFILHFGPFIKGQLGVLFIGFFLLFHIIHLVY
jgi:hypothetical protein